MRLNRSVRRRIHTRATAIARDIRTRDFPDAVRIVEKLIGARVSQKAKAAKPAPACREAHVPLDGDGYSRASDGVGLVQFDLEEP